MMERIQRSGMTLNNKCEFSKTSTKFLGFIIDEGGIHADPLKVAAISKFPAPILVKFATYRARQLVFKQKAYLNPRRRTELQAGAWGRGDTSSSDRQSSTTTEQGERQHVWINEDLTKSRAEMLWRARTAKKDRKIVDCWSSDGRIMIKKSGGEIVQIRRVSDIGK